jgi:hypothetical protein
LPTKKNPDTHSLEERLSRLDWPKAPEGVRERVLDQIMQRFGDVADEPPEPPQDKEPGH